MSKLMLRLVPDGAPAFMAVFNMDARALDNLQLAIMRTPSLMSGEVIRHLSEALLTAEVFQHEEHFAEEPMTLTQVGTISKEEIEALGIKVPVPESDEKSIGGFTQEQVRKAAEAAHEANRVYCREVLMDNSQLPWADAPAWQAESGYNGVVYAIQNNFPSPEAMHENWMKDKVAAGWVYGAVKNPDATPPTHPSLRPYNELPEVERAKDDIFRKTIMASLGVVDQPVSLGVMKEFGPGEGPAILAGLGATPIAIEQPPEPAP